MAGRRFFDILRRSLAGYARVDSWNIRFLLLTLLIATTAIGAEPGTVGCRFADLLRKVATEKVGLDDESLHAVANSETPRNPIASDDHALGTVPSHVFRSAFDRLLSELETVHAWPAIRAEARRLVEARGVAQEKSGVAREGTVKVVEPFVRVRQASHVAVGQTDVSGRRHEVYVSPEGTTFIRYASYNTHTGSTDNHVAVIERDGKRTFTKIDGGAMASIMPSHHGKVSIATYDGVVRLYDARSGVLDQTIPLAARSGHRREMLAFEGATGPQIVLYSTNDVHVIDPTAGETVVKLPEGNHFATVSPDRRKVFVLTQNSKNENIVTEWPGGREVMRRTLPPRQHEGAKITAYETATGEVLMAIRNGADVHVISSKRPTFSSQDFATADRAFPGFVETSDGRLLFLPEFASAGQAMVDLATGTVTTLRPSDTPYWRDAHVARAADGTTLLVTRGEANVELHDLVTDKRRTFAWPHDGSIETAFPSANGGIGTLLWTPATLQLGQVYGPVN